MHVHHDHGTVGRQDPERYQAARRVTLVGAVINVVLSAAKILLGWLGQSQALIADGFHSLSDLVSDVTVLYAAKLGSEHADERHPYGHARIETVATVAIGLLLIVVAGGIAYDAIGRMVEPGRLLHPAPLTLVVALLSVLVKEWLYHYTRRVAKRVRSNLLHANAWHHRSDAISSVVVIVGIAGTMAGLPYLDAVAAVVVGLMIAKAGWDLAAHSVSELVDTGLAPDRLAEIRQAILDIDGVGALHMLRTRKMGSDALVDVHILVDPTISVSEGHQLSERVRWHLIRNVDEVADVTVHIDPEDDEVASPSMHLPLRNRIEAELRRHWHGLDGADRIERITLHYLDGKINVEVLVPLELAADPLSARRLGSALYQRVAGMDEIRQVEAHYR